MTAWLHQRSGRIRIGQRRQDGEDRADGGVHVEIGRSVDRVDGHHQVPAGSQRHCFVALLGAHGGDVQAGQGGQHDVLGVQIHGLLLVATGVGSRLGGIGRGGLGGRGQRCDRNGSGEPDPRIGDGLDRRGDRTALGIGLAPSIEDCGQGQLVGLHTASLGVRHAKGKAQFSCRKQRETMVGV